MSLLALLESMHGAMYGVIDKPARGASERARMARPAHRSVYGAVEKSTELDTNLFAADEDGYLLLGDGCSKRAPSVDVLLEESKRETQSYR